MPDTRPGIKFDPEKCVCFPCLNAESSISTDWGKRENEWLMLVDKHKRKCSSKPYDCIVPVSGGKDSHCQVKRLLDCGMRPLLVCVSDWFTRTMAGTKNWENLCSLGCDSFVWRQDPDEMRHMMRVAFFEEGCPTWPIDAAIYSVPIRVAKMMDIGLICYGENVAHQYGGPNEAETPSAKMQSENDVVKPFGKEWWSLRGSTHLPEWLTVPEQEGIEPVYMSYYFHWSGWKNMRMASRLGFRSLGNEWRRDGYIEDYDQIDSMGYLVHPWLKYPKFGHARATDMASNWIRDGLITRDDGIELVRRHDHRLDQCALDDFLRFTGIRDQEFWAKVEDLYNRDIFHKVDGEWRLKRPIWERK